MSLITPEILLQAYCAGVFPMAESAKDPALYWVEPEERGVIPLNGFHVSRSLRKSVRHQAYTVKVDTAFDQVIAACAASSKNRNDTWINQRIIRLYNQLHGMGHAHSIESWNDGTLMGGLYGVRIGAAFFGESMFSRGTDASKVALVHLVARLRHGGFRLLDTQFVNPHLTQFGVQAVSKKNFQPLLIDALAHEADFFSFKGDEDPDLVLSLAQARVG